jgi:tetratricopeptide (TPR) repeat protein
LGLCLRGLAAPFYSRREYDKAERLCLQAKQVYEETGNMRGVAKILEDLGQIACKRGDLRAAWEFHKAQLSLSEKLGAEDLVASALRVLGDDAFTEGNLQEAKRFYEESRRKKRELGDPNIVPLLLGLGRIAKIYRDEEQARILFSEAEQLYKRRFGYRHEFAELRYEQALLEVQVNNLAVARGYAREAQDIFHRLAMYQEAAEVVSLIARLDEDLAQEKEECRDLAEAHEATTDLDIRE